MAKFEYSGNNKQGKTVTGTIKAIDRKDLIKKLRQDGIAPISIKEVADDDSSDKGINLRAYFGKPTLVDLNIFNRQMYSLTRSGVPLIDAFSLLKDGSGNEVLQQAISDMQVNIQGGNSLSSSMRRHVDIFPPLMVSLIQLGETTGNLDKIFSEISLHLQREMDTKKKIKSAMRYPIMVIATIVIAIAIINLLVIPAFSSFFKGFNAELPLPTKILMATSGFMTQYWYLLLLGLIIGTVGFIYYLRTEQGRFAWDKFKLKIPLVGKVIKKALLARFARSFALTYKAGSPVLESIEIIAVTTDNAYIVGKVMGIKDYIERGGTLTKAIQTSALFPRLVVQMISIGEETGEIDRLLEEVADFYENELDYDLNVLTEAIEPILISIVAVMVLILALGVFLPMWDISQASLQ